MPENSVAEKITERPGTGQKTGISAVIITKNESAQIRRCLDSLRWADEVVIVDDLSTDDTQAICAEYGCTIISNASGGNFDRQRNMGIDQAANNWVLQLDADEVVSDALAGEIRTALAGADDTAAFEIRRVNHFLGKPLLYGGWSNYVTKIVRKGRARYTGKYIHETLMVDGPLRRLTQPIDHYPFRSISVYVARMNHYTDQEASRMFEEQGLLPKRAIARALVIKPFKVFWKGYILRKGYREGIRGLIFGLLDIAWNFVRVSKYVERYIIPNEQGRQEFQAKREGRNNVHS